LIPQWNAEYRFNPREGIIHRCSSLIAEARQEDPMQSPFLFTQAQLWVRELSGIFRVVSEDPCFHGKKMLTGKNTLWPCRPGSAANAELPDGSDQT
jgi:DEAD/DEAH box helicase domain-containing protein